MDDILQDSPSGQYELGDLVDTTPVSTPIPHSSVRNRAAMSAVLSGSEPDKLIEKYRLMMQEGEEGKTATHDEIMYAMSEQGRVKNMRYVMQVMGDKSLSLEQKKRVMQVAQTGAFNKDEPAQVLRTKALEAPAKGEDVKGESARISLADTMEEIHAESQDRQRMVNGMIAKHPDATLGTVGEVAEAEVMPFGRNIIAAKVAAKVDELDGKDFSLGKWIKNFLTPGTTKQELQQRLISIPPAKRGAFTAKLLQAVKESATVFPSENYYAQFTNAVNFLDSAPDSNAEAWTENAMTLFDAFWVGSELKAAGKALKGTPQAVYDTSKARRPGSANPGVSDAENVVESAKWDLVGDPYNPNQIGPGRAKLEYKRADAQERIELNSVVHRENPVAPYNIVAQSNPESARELHSMIVQSGDEVAEALTGVSREQHVANAIYPQIGTDSGNVLYKVDQSLVEQVQNTGALRYTDNELGSAVAGIERDFRNAHGLQINDAMTTFKVDGDHVVFQGHYSTPGGAFLTPEAAREQAKYALKDYGIRDDEIQIMVRDGMDYVPYKGESVKSQDYIVKIETKQALDDSQVEEWDFLDVKRNSTDRNPWTLREGKGNLSNWLLDPSAMLHPKLTGSAAVASDQSVVLETMLLEPVHRFRLAVKELPDARRTKLEDYIKEANIQGIKMDDFDLVSRGFVQKEIDALHEWKNIWDKQHYLENYDLVRTLNSQGFQILDNGATKLFGKSVPKNQNIGAVLDPSTGQVRNLPVADMDALYNTGGSYIKLRRPIDVNGMQVEYAMVRNTPSEYMRKIRDTDSILNYRDGYYTINYSKAAKFIDEITVDSKGNEVRRTIGVAGNTKDAETFKNAQQASTGNRHEVREDVRGYEKDGDGFWDVNTASGRIAQRLRGQPLVSAKGINQVGAGVFVDSPLDSAARAARSISGRTLNRTAIETAKARFMRQFEDLLPPDGMGGRMFPTSYSQIVDHQSHVSKRVGDARTTFGYIKYLEDGYINGMDNLYKGGMHMVAKLLDGVPMVEEALLQAAQKSPTRMAKATVFNAYIVGSNPVRQWIVQPHQFTRMMAYNPVGMAGGGVIKKLVGFIGENAGFAQSAADIKAFIKFVDDSGMVAGVDRNSLVRGLKMELADRSGAIAHGIEGTRSALQTLGFDLGEKLNQLGHLAAVHDKWTRQGKNLADKTVRDAALAEARALSYYLNSASEFAYTQSSFAAVLQFLQMPHKGIAQLMNRKLPRSVRARLAAWDLVMFGTGVGTVNEIVRRVATAAGEDGSDILPDDPEIRDMFVYGVESYALNKMFSMMDEDGGRSRIDFSALSPNDMEGWAKMWHALMDDGMFAMFAASPIGQLVAVDGVGEQKRHGRIPQALITLGRYFNERVFDSVPFDPNKPTEFTAVLNDAARISSGWTAAQNAWMMIEARKKVNAAGGVIDGSVTYPELWATGLGFGTLSTKELYNISRNRIEEKKAYEKDIDVRYRAILNYYKESANTPGADMQHVQQVSSLLMKTFANDPVAMTRVLRN